MLISFAQNFEDVILYRALKHIKKGFYIDVGAMDPELSSVTKVFYDRDWSGINIEPMKQYYSRLNEERKRDINLNIAMGDGSHSKLQLYEIPDTGYSTALKKYANHHKRRGFTTQKIKVDCQTLNNIVNLYRKDKAIHFLKIDVEGSEYSVLKGIDFKKIRPWIVVVESIKPDTMIDVSHEWEDLLLNNRYSLVYFDGLNKFYLADERDKLRKKFDLPPNVFDSFITGDLHLQKKINSQNKKLFRKLKNDFTKREKEFNEKLDYYDLKNKRLNNEKEFLNKQIEILMLDKERLQSEFQRLETELDFIYTGWSWKITIPLRIFKSFLSEVFSFLKILIFLPIKIIKFIVIKIFKIRLLRNIGKKILTPFPRLKEKIKNIEFRIRTRADAKKSGLLNIKINDLSERGHILYNILKSK